MKRRMNMPKTVTRNNTMKRFMKIASAATAALCLVSCGGGMKVDEEELRTALGELIEKSAELNEIYFGEGLPMTEDAEVLESFYSSFDSDVKSINYHPVDPECGYTNETELRDATLEVFTENYSEYLFERAFSGISATYDEGTEDQYTSTAVYAMYIEENGVLTARIDIADEAMHLGRTYDLSGMEIIRTKENYVVVKIPSEMDGKPLDIELKVVMTENGWRLDSPTY